MEEAAKNDTENGVSPGLKATVIGLTVLTFIAFLIFMGLLFKRAFSGILGGNGANQHTLKLAQKLEKEGFSQLAVTQYENYFNSGKLKPAERAKTAFSIGRLHLLLKNCSDAVVWLFRNDISDPVFSEKKEIRQKIEICRNKLNSSFEEK